jgi:hypothetical protein
MKLKIAISLITLLFFTFSYADVGTSSAQFLKIPKGARAASLGECFSSISDDVYGVYYNPSSIARINKVNISFTHRQWLSDIEEQYFVFTAPILEGVIATDIIYFHMGDVETREDVSGNLLGSYKSYDFSFGISFARNLNSNISFGGKVKFIRLVLENESANSFAFDAGIMIYMLEEKLNLGISIQHVGTKIKFINESFPLPLTVRIGMNYKLLNSVLLLAEINKQIDTSYQVSCGIEYSFNRIFFIRVGYVIKRDYLFNFSGGIGVHWNDISLDYAFVPQKEFGNTHTISFSYRIP